eukprot:TRINITY_DN7206_c0_g5_i1.p1 TRINITY_DN7206_c0_g5~~TRINITY_DN7206_c0_g5_i1.p1  ORF type:complete len:268 (-),score=24.61 TRINITY_DN7206_c0_g5_i1:18-821(-)
MHRRTEKGQASEGKFEAANDDGSFAPLSRPKLLDGKPLIARLRWYPPPVRLYSRRELIADRCVNFLGAGLSWPAAVVIIYFAWARGVMLVMQFGILAFGVGLVAMFNVSAYNHHCCWEQTRSLLLGSLDHIGIDAVIVGSYSPVCIFCRCYGLLAFVVALGGLGLMIEVIEMGPGKYVLNSGFRRPYQLSLCGRYLVMGWSIAASWQHIILPASTSRFLLIGGIFISAGVMSLLRASLEFHKCIWHTCVLFGMICMYAGIFELLVPV